LTLDFKELAHPVMVLVEGTRLDKGQQYWTKDTNTRQRTTILDKGQQYWTKDNNTRQRTTILNKGQQYRTKDNNTEEKNNTGQRTRQNKGRQR